MRNSYKREYNIAEGSEKKKEKIKIKTRKINSIFMES